MNYNHEGLPIGIFHQMLKSILDQYYRGTKANKPLLVFIVQYFLVNLDLQLGQVVDLYCILDLIAHTCISVLFFHFFCLFM